MHNLHTTSESPLCNCLILYVVHVLCKLCMLCYANIAHKVHKPLISHNPYTTHKLHTI